MSKRGSDRQLTKDSKDDDGEVDLTPGTFARASEDVMRERKIRSLTPPKTSLASTPSTAEVSATTSTNPFAKIELTKPTMNAAVATQPTPFSAKRDAAEEPSRSSKRVKFGGTMPSSTVAAENTPRLFSSNNSNRALPAAAAKAVENARKLNDAFVDRFLEESRKNPSRDFSNMSIEYGRYARSIMQQYNQERGMGNTGSNASASAPVAAPIPAASSSTSPFAASTSATKPTFNFGAPQAPSPAPAAGAFSFGSTSALAGAGRGFTFGAPAPAAAVAAPLPAPAPADNAPESEADTADGPPGPEVSHGDYETIFKIDGVLRYDVVNGTMSKPIRDLSFNIEKNANDGKYIGIFRIGFIAVTTFRITKDMQFTVVDRANAKKPTVRTLSFQTSTAEEPEKVSTFELRLKDQSFYPSLFEELRKCGAVVKERDAK